MLRTFALAVSVSFAPPAAADAQDAAEIAAEAAASFGPAVGETAPALRAQDAAGVERTLADLSGEKGAVVYFNRSLDWCPICVRQTLEVQDEAGAFAEAGWGVAVLTLDDADTLARAAARREITLPLLADPAGAVIRAFDVADPVYADPANRAHGAPYPIAFALSPQGEVLAKFWHEGGLGDDRGYAVRVTAEDVLEALDAL